METRSPCIKVCLLDPESRICSGCGRTLEEIAGWLRLAETDRLKVAAELPERLQRLKQRAA